MMIHEFNLALQHKQLWLLVQFSDSLLARVLREKQFRCSSHLKLNKIDNSSYGWTRIMTEQPLLLIGIRQKVHSMNELGFGKTFGYQRYQLGQLDPLHRWSIRYMIPVSELLIGNPKDGTLIYQKTMSIRRISHRSNLWPYISQGYHRDEYCQSYKKSGMLYGKLSHNT